MFKKPLNKNCDRCIARHGIENDDNRFFVRCDQASHAICERLASPIIPNWKEHIEWNKIEVKMLE